MVVRAFVECGDELASIALRNRGRPPPRDAQERTHTWSAAHRAPRQALALSSAGTQAPAAAGESEIPVSR